MFDISIKSSIEIKYNLYPRFQQRPQMELTDPPTKAQLTGLLTTNIYTGHQVGENQDNLSIFMDNIILYCKLVEHQQIDSEGASELIMHLKSQLNQLWFQQKLKRFSDQFKFQVEGQKEVEPFQKKLYELEQVIRAVSEQKNNASSEEKYIVFENQVNKYIQELQSFIDSDNLKHAIDGYSLYGTALPNQEEEAADDQGSEIDIPSTHFFKELIKTDINYGPVVFSSVRPENHQLYITEAAKTYHSVAPFKIKNISLSITDGPIINRPNYFHEDLDQSKAILCTCVPGTKKIGFYSLADVCKIQTVGKEFYQEKELANEWCFSKDTRSVITTTGKIYAINCRTTKQKIDPYLYEITEYKASNRGPLLSPKRDASILYLGGFIYMIGGQGDGQKCSRKNYRYSIKEKKWYKLCESNVALRKPTICVVSNRYILKLGGLNQFDYINKVIEMYDTMTDRWSMVRASPRNILEQIQILEDSQAIQINDDQIYIFGGKNSNKFNTDTAFVLMISEIREKRKGAAKVTGEFWNVSIGKRNILTFFGQFYASSVVIQHNCIYGLRTEVSKALTI